MDKAKALQSFWASFGWPAIDEESEWDEETMEALGDPDRYISYESATGELDEKVALNASLWHRSSAWTEVEKKTAEISFAIGPGGILVKYDGGAIWITRGGRFSKRGSSPDYGMRRIILTINAEFLSA